MKKKKLKPIKVKTVNKIEIYKKKDKYLAIPTLTKNTIKRFNDLEEAVEYASDNLDYIYKGVAKNPIYKNDDLGVYKARDMDFKYYIVKRDGMDKVMTLSIRPEPCIEFVNNIIMKKKLST